MITVEIIEIWVESLLLVIINLLIQLDLHWVAQYLMIIEQRSLLANGLLEQEADLCMKKTADDHSGILELMVVVEIETETSL